MNPGETHINALLEALCSQSKKDWITRIRDLTGLPQRPKLDLFTKHYLSRRKDANPTYLLEYRGRKYVKFVVRLAPTHGSNTGIHNIAREYRILESLYHTKTIPVTKPLVFEDDSKIGRQFFIREYVDGMNFTDASMTKCYGLKDHNYETNKVAVKDTDKELCFKSAVRVLAQLHNLAAPGSPVYNAYVAVNGVQGQSIQNFWRQRVGLWKTSSDVHDGFNDMQQLQNRLTKMSPNIMNVLPSVIHGDYNFRNLVFDPNTREVKAVLDWEMAGIGDALCDLAEFLLCLVKPADCGYHISLPNSFQFNLPIQITKDAMFQVHQDVIISRRQQLGIQQYFIPWPRMFSFALATACLRFASIFKVALADGEHRGHECYELMSDGSMEMMITVLCKGGCKMLDSM